MLNGENTWKHACFCAFMYLLHVFVLSCTYCMFFCQSTWKHKNMHVSMYVFLHSVLTYSTQTNVMANGLLQLPSWNDLADSSAYMQLLSLTRIFSIQYSTFHPVKSWALNGEIRTYKHACFCAFMYLWNDLADSSVHMQVLSLTWV